MKKNTVNSGVTLTNTEIHVESAEAENIENIIQNYHLIIIKLTL